MSHRAPAVFAVIALLTVLASPISAGEEAVPPTGPDAAATPPPAAAEEQADRPYWRKNLFKRVFSDQKFLFTDWIGQEAHRPGVTMPLLAGVALAAASHGEDLNQPDLRLERQFNASVTEEQTGTAQALTSLGEAGTGIVLLSATYLIGRFGGHERLSEASSLSAEALIDTGLWTTILKKVTARTRPSGGADGRFFEYQPEAGQSNASFPSGHASGAFALATVFSGLFGEDHRWVSWVAYGAAGMVAVSRVGLGRHFTSDVVVGGVIGNSFGRMVLARRNSSGEAHRVRTTFAPAFDPQTREAGVELTLRW